MILPPRKVFIHISTPNFFARFKKVFFFKSQEGFAFYNLKSLSSNFVGISPKCVLLLHDNKQDNLGF